MLMFNLNAPFLYFVTPEISHLPTLERLVQSAVNGGVQMVQLRSKTSPPEEIARAAEQLLPFLKSQGVPLLINDQIEVAHAVKADGVHLGQSDGSPSRARALLGEKAIIGLSVENLEQAAHAAAEPVDYLAASPLFPTKSKSDCAPPWGVDGLRKLVATSAHPIVAIGGIQAEQIEELLSCGAQGIAIVSAIANAPCPKLATEKLSKLIYNFVHSHSKGTL